jgi:hypothetical protein
MASPACEHGQVARHRSAAPPAIARCWLPCLAAALALAAGGCSHAGRTGQVDAQSRFFGNVPDGGQLVLAAVNSRGRVFVSGRIGPDARRTLTVPPGTYTVGVWLPGAGQLSAAYALCSRGVTVMAGRASAVTLSCEWH